MLVYEGLELQSKVLGHIIYFAVCVRILNIYIYIEGL